MDEPIETWCAVKQKFKYSNRIFWTVCIIIYTQILLIDSIKHGIYVLWNQGGISTLTAHQSKRFELLVPKTKSNKLFKNPSRIKSSKCFK